MNQCICTTSMLPHELERISQESAVKPAQDCKLCYFLPFVKNKCNTYSPLLKSKTQQLQNYCCPKTAIPARFNSK